MEQVRGPQRPIQVPHLWLVGVLFDHMGTMAGGNPAVYVVEAGGAMRNEMTQWRMETRNRPQVTDSAEDDGRPGNRELTDQMIEIRLESLSRNPSDQVVGAHRHEDQVRVEFDGRCELVLDEIVGA